MRNRNKNRKDEMKTYKTQAEVEAEIKDGVWFVLESVTIEASIKISARIEIVGDIDARNIDARNIRALNINALNINAWNINALDINARNIIAQNINASDIIAQNINASDINFYAVCVAYVSFKCKSWKAQRDNGKAICMDSEIVIYKMTGEVN